MTRGSKFLSHDFLSRYEGKSPKNKGILFEVVYLRTYSRWLPDKKRRETWLETVERVVEYNVGLYQGPAKHSDLVKEAELMFDKVFNLEVLPAGRSLWIGGTEASVKYSESNFNCSALVIKGLEDFCDIFHLLMCGCGVGYRILESDVSSLPILNWNFTIEHQDYSPLHPAARIEDTIYQRENDCVVRITVGDSKKAWVDALRYFLSTLAVSCGREIRIIFNYDSVRPSGERIRTFGGRAAGPQGLKDMFLNIERVVKEKEGILNPVACMDIANMIAKNVLVGGTRRSAQIALGSPSDDEFITAKRNLYKRVDGKWIKDSSKEHRTMSNNSVTFTSKPSLEEIKNIFSNIKDNGEPGFFNLEAALKRRPNANTANPCLEILLDDYGVCNLSTVVLSSHIVGGSLDLGRLAESMQLATRIGMRQTNVSLSLPHWDRVQKRDRLTGVSITGYMDTMDRLEMSFYNSDSLLESLNVIANEESVKYAFEMRIPVPLLVTAIKPEGTLSLLPTVSPGLHRSYSPYYIRRIRVSELDPVCKALRKLGVPNEPDATKSSSGRVVFSFPVASGASIAANDEPATDQFNRYLLMQKKYTDHNSSCTLTVGADEWESISQAVYENWDDVVACAFLPKDDMSYPQMPLEAITEEKYNEMVASFPDLTELAKLVNKLELEESEEDELIDDACSTGQCPVR